MANMGKRSKQRSYGKGVQMQGCFVGIMSFLLAVAILLFNEGNVLAKDRKVDDVLEEVVPLSSTEVDPANEGSLVHVVGKPETSSAIQDDVFGFSAPDGTLVLRRHVEMYQWIEDQEDSSDEEYEYTKDWSAHVIVSDDFDEEGHDNPEDMEYDSRSFVAEHITFGDFELNVQVAQQMSWFSPAEQTISMDDIIDEELRSKLHEVDGGHTVFYGASPEDPQVGDLRINFKLIKPSDEISILAAQKGNSFAKYDTVNGRKGVLDVERGSVGAERMLQNTLHQSQVWAWPVRGVGFAILYTSLVLMSGPLAVMGQNRRWLGGLVGTGSPCMMFPVALIIALILIGIAQLLFFPAFGFLMLMGAFLLSAQRYDSNKEIKITEESYQFESIDAGETGEGVELQETNIQDIETEESPGLDA